MQLKNFLPYQLSILSNKVSRGIAQFYRDQHDITIPEWRVLLILSNINQQTAKQLAEHSQMDKVKISRTMKVLLSKGYVNESKCDKDARSRIYHLTNEGLNLINKVKPKALAFEKQLLESLSQQQIIEFQSCLNTLGLQVDKINKKK